MPLNSDVMKNVNLSINNIGRIRLGYAVAFLLLLFSYLGTLYANRRFTEQAQWVNHSNQIIANLETMIARVTDAESGLRGYWLTGNPDFLRPYEKARESTDTFFDDLIKQTADNDIYQQKLAQLRTTLDKRFYLFDYNLRLYNNNDRKISDSLLNMLVQSKATMDRVRMEVTQMQTTEKALLAERNIRVQKTTNGLNAINIISVIIASGLVLFGFSAHAKENKAKQSAEEKMRNYQEELKKRIDELDKANIELVRMRVSEKFAATGRIARTIAHEVRNPLTNINLATDQLKAEFSEDIESTNFLFDMINRNSSRINQLISDLLNSTKFAELSFNKISANDLLEETLKEAKDRISLNNVEVIKKYDKDICDVSVDKEKIKIALLNIIINALEAIDNRKGGKLILETKASHEKCRISITDNGIGMDDEEMNRLFEPYFTSKPKGNGLGLTNTHNIILNHKGEIAVKSKKEIGTTFIITLDFAE
ncbi:MAG: CHASE3 domain-containing protein [Chitinophagaceae bacterium]